MNSLQNLFVRKKKEVKPGFGLGKLQTIVFEETVETKLRQPTFITEYPAGLLHLLAVMMIIRTLLIVLSSLLVAVNWQTALVS